MKAIAYQRYGPACSTAQYVRMEGQTSRCLLNGNCIIAWVTTWLHKLRMLHCDRTTLNAHAERQKFYVIATPQSQV
jgi:hypothetical protein